MKTDTNIKMLRIFYKLSLIFFVISSTVITPGNGNLCGVVNLRSEKVVENGTVEIEYYPSTNVMRNSGSFIREWRQFVGRTGKKLKLTDGNYQETLEQNNIYVLTIYMFNISMNGRYRVFCGGSEALYTDEIIVHLQGDYSLSKCGKLSIDKPTILGRNVTFSFTPDTYDPNATQHWMRSMNGIDHWYWLDSRKTRTIFEKNMIYYLIIIDSDKDNDEVFYRVNYYNETVKCDVYAGKLTLEELPSVPIIIGLQDIENCTDCIVGEDLEMFDLSCQIHAGSRPINVTMTIGNESHTPHKINSTTYMVLFTVRDRHHMEHVTFSVMNDLLSSPLNVTARMFVIKSPTFQFSVPEILKDGEGVSIACTMDDGRPNPHVYFNISGSEVSSANSHFYNSTTSLNTNIITLTTFKKEWNKESITCCRYNEWYTTVRDCLPPKQVNYLFPPTDVMLEVKVDEDSLSQMYATCTVYGSNPVCSVQFKATSGIIGSEKSSENISLPHGAWNSVFEVNLNVSEEDNGKDVTCVVECGEFAVNLTDTVKILMPSKPDDKETGDDMSTSDKNETCEASGAVIGSVIVALAVGILIGVICTLIILIRKGIIAGSKTQQTVSHEIELTGPPTALDTYEQLQNRTDTEIRGTYDSLEVNSGVQPNSQSQYESLNEEAENYHTYTDLKESQ